VPILDTLTVPALRCDVAHEAERCRHSFLRNGFALLSDKALASWLKDIPAMREFRKCLDVVCAGIPQFSGVHIVDQIRPLADLSARERNRLSQILAVAFEDGFRPERATLQLRVSSDKLLSLIQAFQTDSLIVELSEVRSAASALLVEMRRLPAGLLLPQRTTALCGANVDAS